MQFEEVDNELAYMMSSAALELTKSSVKSGSLLSALKYSAIALEYADKTVYDTAHIKALLPIYNAIAKNIQAPLLEYNDDKYQSNLSKSFEYELYQYLTQNYAYAYETPIFKKHSSAKEYIKARNYYAAVKLLLEAVEDNNTDYNAFVQFGL